MKEPLLAIIIGFIIGLVITFGIWTANKSLKQAQNPNAAAASPTPSLEPNITPSATPSVSPAGAGLTITSPDNESIFNTTSTKLTGTAPAGSVITLVGGPNEQILQADLTGQFSTEIDLESGYNLLTITAFDPTGKSFSKVITLTYTTAKI